LTQPHNWSLSISASVFV